MKALLHAIALTVAAGWISPAMAQSMPAKDITDQAQTVTSEKHPEDQDASVPSAKPDIVVAPIPISNPAIGTGLGAAGVLFYNPNRSSRPWITGVGAGYTSSKTWAAGAFHSMSLGHDSVRLMAFAGYGDARVHFYGIGPEAGEEGISVKMRDKAIIGLLDVQARPINEGLLSNFYLGGRMFILDLDASVTLPIPGRPEIEPPVLERASRISMIGPAVTYDSRDSSTYPRKGVFATGWVLFGADWLGSDFGHHKMQTSGNAYFPLAEDTVVGVRGSLCDVSSDAPYYDLCFYGQQGDLRGYETGRYRDGASWALQAEVRQHLFWKLGGVVFAGVGGIADTMGSIWDDSTILPSVGIGVRFLASEGSNVNVRVDAAWGKDGGAIYFGIGEAF